MTHDFTAVLEFWFAGCAHDPVAAEARGNFWFGVDPTVDAQIRDRFTLTIEAAAAGALAEWEAEARSALALVVVLDQFPRNAWRATARAFSCDEHALRVARSAVERGHLGQLSPVEATFLILPFEHSESLASQQESVRLAQRLVDEAAPPWRRLMKGYYEYAADHLRLIERFGRFPHRNRVLGRASTAEEMAYLSGGAQSYGQDER